jgi:hypothetical protein
MKSLLAGPSVNLVGTLGTYDSYQTHWQFAIDHGRAAIQLCALTAAAAAVAARPGAAGCESEGSNGRSSHGDGSNAIGDLRSRLQEVWVQLEESLYRLQVALPKKEADALPR